MGDFDACRFDFRIDGKNGLTPSKRKRGFKRSVYNTLFNCKVCGSLFENRPALLAHKLMHAEHPCTFCQCKFKKKNHLREHVNSVHYIDKLKAGYKSEYNRGSKSVSGDLNTMSSSQLPPLIPVSDIDQSTESHHQPNVDNNPVETAFRFGTDAMATSSPISGSQSLLHSDIKCKEETGQPSEFPRLPIPVENDMKSPPLSEVSSSSPVKFPEFPFGGFPGVTNSAHLSHSQNVTFPPSALQSAMASFFPFSQATMMQNQTDETNKHLQNVLGNPLLSYTAKDTMAEAMLRQNTNNLQTPQEFCTSKGQSETHRSDVELDTNVPAVISLSSPLVPSISTMADIPMPSLISPSNGSHQHVQSHPEPVVPRDLFGSSTIVMPSSSTGIQSMSKISLGKLLTTPPIPDLSVLTSIASNKLKISNISSTNPMSLLPKFPAAASYPILSSVGPTARTALSDQAVTSITPSSLQTVMTAPVPTSTKQSLPVIMPKPNGLPQNPFKPIATTGTGTSNIGPIKKAVPATAVTTRSHSAATQVSLLKSSGLPPVAPIAPPPNIFLTASNAAMTASTAQPVTPPGLTQGRTSTSTVASVPKMASSLMSPSPLMSPSLFMSPSPLMSPSHPLQSITPSTGSGIQVSLQQPQTPVPTPSPTLVTAKPPQQLLPPPASLASLLTGVPLQAGLPPSGLHTLQGSNISSNNGLPPGYMMMTLVLTTQPGGGVAAVPVIPGYSYPGLTTEMTTQPPTACAAVSGIATTPVSSQMTRCVVPPITSVASTSSNHGNIPQQPPTITPRFSLLNNSHPVKPSAEIEPGEITKSRHIMPTTLMLPQQPVAERTERMNTSHENRYFLNLAPADPGNDHVSKNNPLSPHADVSMATTNIDVVEGNRSRESGQMDISDGSVFSTSSTMQQQVVVKSNKRKQSFPAKNTQVKKKQPTLGLDSIVDDNTSDSDEQQSGGKSLELALDLSAKAIHTVSGEDSDRAAMLDQYSSNLDMEAEEMMECGEKEAWSTSMCSNTSTERYSCDQCSTVCENVYMLNKHRTRAHQKVHKGLTKMVDRLWKYKKDNKSTSDEQAEQPIAKDSTPDSVHTYTPVEMNHHHHSMDSSSIQSLTRVDHPKLAPQNTNNNSNSNLSRSLSGEQQPSTPTVDPEEMISDTAKQVYIQMMNTGLKMLEDGDCTTTMTPSPLLSQNSTGGSSQARGPLKVSECETDSGTFGHYRIKKPRFDDYCTFKFHTCKVCKQLFNTAEEMWDHALIHKELQKFKCSSKGCGYSSASREKLLQHKATLHPRTKKTIAETNLAMPQSSTESFGMVPPETDDQQQPASNPMDEFTLLGQQQHYPCEFEGCDSVFFSANELMKHVDRVHQKLQCPEAGCTRMFYTMGGLKSHQMSHLEEDGPFACTTCLKMFSFAKDLRLHKATRHGGLRSLECPLCQYSAKHRSSMNWHMKSRHNLEKAMTTKMGKNQTVYVDASGNVVCSSRSDRSGAAVDLSETSSGDGDLSGSSVLPGDDSGVHHTTETGHHDNRGGERSLGMNDVNAGQQHITMETQGQEIQIVKNEPEELAVGDNNTIATTDGTVLGPAGTYRSELVYVEGYNNNNDSDQPLDFSMKKAPVISPSNHHLSPGAASPQQPSHTEVSSNLKEGTPNKTPVGIVQPFVHLPSVSQALYAPQLPLLSSSNLGDGDVTPPLPQLVPMANPFIPGLVASHQFMALQSGGATGNATPPRTDGQFFSFKLNNNNNNNANTSARKSSTGNGKRAKSHSERNLDPMTFSCTQCGMMFECAEIMWHHKLQEHKETTNIYCDTCTFETKDQGELQSHMMSTHGKEVGDNKTFMCFICSKGYSSKLGLNHHLMRHSEGGPPQFPCPYRGCDSVLHSRGALGNHVKRVHLKPSSKQTVIDESKQVFYCDYPRCDRSFRESKHLRVHRMTHTDEKPLKCHLCEYSCRQRNSMNWHMKSKHGLEKKVSLDGKTIYV